MKKLFVVFAVATMFVACKPKEEAAQTEETTTVETTVADSTATTTVATDSTATTVATDSTAK